MLDILRKKLNDYDQEAFFSVFPSLHEVLDEFVRQQTKLQLSLVFTFQTISGAGNGDGETATMFIQHLCTEYADKFKIDEKITNETEDEDVHIGSEEWSDEIGIKLEPEDEKVLDERQISPGKRKKKTCKSPIKPKRSRKPPIESRETRYDDIDDNDDVSSPLNDALDETEKMELKAKQCKRSKKGKTGTRKKKRKDSNISHSRDVAETQDTIDKHDTSVEDNINILSDLLDSCLDKPEFDTQIKTNETSSPECIKETEENDSTEETFFSSESPESHIDKCSESELNAHKSTRDTHHSNEIVLNRLEQVELRLDSDESKYKCYFGKCEFTSKFKGSLKRHVLRVHDKSSVKCKCGMVFSDQSKLDEHARRVHRSLEECELCGETFKLKTQLRHHYVQYHTLVRRFSCPICDKKFNNKTTYEGHVDSHNGVKRHTCPKCPRSFTYRSSLTKHLPLCKPKDKSISFMCKICGREFKLKSYLNTHMKGIHKSGKQFLCVCGQGFSWSGSLSNHRKICRIHNAPLQ